MSKDVFVNEMLAAVGIASVVITADTNGATLDLQGYDWGAFIANVGIEGLTLSGSVKFDFEIQDSADDSTFAAAANDDVIDGAGAAGTTVSNAGTFATADASAEIPAQFIGHYTGTARYSRCVVNATGTHTTGTAIGVTNIKGNAKVLPRV